MGCGELAAALQWLGMTVDTHDVHALMRALDASGDGMLSLAEWSAAFGGLPSRTRRRSRSSPRSSCLLGGAELYVAAGEALERRGRCRAPPWPSSSSSCSR